MSSIPVSIASGRLLPLRTGRKESKEKVYRLFECTYACHHLWVSAKNSFSEKCPNCPNVSPTVIENFVHADLKFKKMQAVTFAKHRFYGYGVSTFEHYKKDSLLDTLEAQGFKLIRTSQTEIALENEINEHVLFIFSKSRKTSTVYIGLHNENDPLFAVLENCAKQDKKNKDAEPKPAPKPQIAKMLDALGKDVTIGDWVCAWGTKNLSFGKIIAIEKFKECAWHAEKDMIVGAKIKKGSVILPYKTSNQIFLLTQEQSLILALEQ